MDATMASVGALSPGKIVKEGFLTTEKKRLHGALKSDVKNWWVLAQDQGTVLACYKDDTKKKLQKEIRSTDDEKVEVDRQKYDNYISIRHGKQITHLRAESKQQCIEWYCAINDSLQYLGVSSASTDDDGTSVSRRRNTDTSSDRPAVRRRRKQADTQSTPDLDLGVNEITSQQLPAIPEGDSDEDLAKIRQDQGVTSRQLPAIPGDDSDEDLAKIRQDQGVTSRQLLAIPGDDSENDLVKIRQAPRCCLRNHLEAYNHEGSNMADECIVYENVHFVRSEEEYLAAAKSRKDSLLQTEKMYDSFHNLGKILNTDENIYESRIPRAPEEHDERELVGGGDGDSSSSPRDSLSSNEDNTEQPPGVLPRSSAVVGPARPSLPPCKGELLRRKIQQLKEEQRQPHGIHKTFAKSSLVGEKDTVTLMEVKDGIWVIGWDSRLRNALKVGDQLVKVNRQVLPSATFATDTIRSTDGDKVTLVLKRIPHAFVCFIPRQSASDDLGFRLEGNEIISVDPYGLASMRGELRPQTTGVSGRMCNWAVTEINTQPVDLFASADDIMKLLRQAGTDVALIVQPVDFIQMMRDNLKPDPLSVEKSSFKTLYDLGPIS